MLNKVNLQKLKIIKVLGGDVLHAFKKSDSNFDNFGEAYFSTVNPGVVKGWKLHKNMTCNLIVPIGEIKFVISKNLIDFDIFELGESNYSRLTIPPNFWFAFKCISKSKSIILNISNMEHDPREYEKKLINEINYDWR